MIPISIVDMGIVCEYIPYLKFRLILYLRKAQKAKESAVEATSQPLLLDVPYSVVLTLIETRGEGGLFLCAPSPGYAIIQRSLNDIQVLTSEERDLLIEAAGSLNEHIPQPDSKQLPAAQNGSRPGDDFNRRGDVRDVLVKHSWRQVKSGENEYWRRPGKDRGWSATLKNNVFYVFSASASPFEPSKAYSPFGVYAQLEHDGDYAGAAAALAESGFGTPQTRALAVEPDEPEPLPPRILTPAELYAFDTDDDPNTLLGKAHQLFGAKLPELLEELNEVLAA